MKAKQDQAAYLDLGQRYTSTRMIFVWYNIDLIPY